jgi:hypothetical protein
MLAWMVAKWAATATFRKRTGSIPWQFWALLALVVALWLGIRWHAHEIEQTWQSGYDAGYAKAQEEQRQLAAAVDKRSTQISNSERSKNDEAVRNIHDSADAISMRGPGKAGANCPSLAAAPSGPEPATEQPSPATASLPPEDREDPLATVSWRWLVGTGKQCDLERAENVSWRNWYQAQAKSWPSAQPASSPSPDAR